MIEQDEQGEQEEMGGPIRILLSFPPPRGVYNPYTIMLTEAVRDAPETTVLNFSWRRALEGRYDVFHVHWPEILVSGQTPAKKAIRQVLFVGFMARMWATSVPIVRTVHNVERPSGLSWRERVLLDWIDHRTSLWITLNEFTEVPPGADRVVIPHGHYVEWFASIARAGPRPGLISYFGRIRRYKGVERLISAFREVDLSRIGPVSLCVAGLPSSEEIVTSLTDLANGDEAISFDWGFQSDEAIVALVSASELVVLPYVSMHNSGAVLAALSLRTAVLVPDNDVNRALAAEVGPGWMHLFQGKLTAQDIEQAILASREGLSSAAPDLSRRDWARAGAAHVGAYRRARLRLRGRRA